VEAAAKKEVEEPGVHDLVRSVQAVQRRLDDDGEGSPPYCAVIGVADGAPAKSRAPGKTAGLISELDVRRGEARFVVTLWATRDAFRRGASAFLAGLGGTSTVLQQGYVAEVAPRRGGFWSRTTLGTKLVSLVAILGALSALYTYAGTIFEPASVGVVHATPDLLNLLAGDEIRSQIRVVARTRASSVVIDTIPVALVPQAGDASPFKADYQMLPALAPGQSQELAVSGPSPAKRPGSTEPERYDLQATVVARGGLLSWQRRFPSPPRQVRIWQELQWTEAPAPSSKCQAQCLFTGQIYAGRNYPNGVRVQVSIADGRLNLGGLTIDGVSTKGNPSQGSSVSTGIWQTGALQGFNAYPYSILVQARDSTKAVGNWQGVKPNIVLQE
jgi:hypothetical protein